MLSRNIQADILSVLADGKVHTYQSIADEIEVHRNTVYNHIRSLSYRHNIETFSGGIDKGGVRLIPDEKIKVGYLSNDELQLIINQLELLQSPNANIKQFIKSISSHKDKEKKDERRIV